MSLTITEALAEIKTIGKRIEKKREYIGQYIARQDGLKDPLLNDGGSAAVIAREMQAMSDLETRLINLRRGIETANTQTNITVEGIERSINDWLVWRREVAPLRQKYLLLLRNTLDQTRRQAQSKGVQILSASVDTSNAKPTDYIVNIDEAALNKETEQLENILGTLDGQLSLKNATTFIPE